MVKLSFTRIFKMSRIVHIEILFFIYLCCIVNRLTTLHSLALQAGYFDDKEYLFVQAAINFTSANAECKEMGGELVSPKNEIQDRFIRGKIHNSTTEWWTSGHPVSSGDFEWVDGTIFSKEHENWYPGWVNDAGVTGNVQPSMGSSELCVEYRRQYYNDLSELVTVSRYYWNDTGCSSQKFFICQKQKMCGFEYKSDAKCDKEKGEKYLKRKKQQMKSGGEINRTEARSRLHCVALCFNTSGCLSVNYQQGKSRCQLVMDTEGTLIPNPDYTYIGV